MEEEYDKITYLQEYHDIKFDKRITGMVEMKVISELHIQL